MFIFLATKKNKETEKKEFRYIRKGKKNEKKNTFKKSTIKLLFRNFCKIYSRIFCRCKVILNGHIGTSNTNFRFFSLPPQ